MPWVVLRPSEWMSVSNISRPASAWFLVRPNSFAALMALMVSPPAFARPITLALDDCAWRRNEEKSEVFRGWRTVPSTLPPAARTASAVSFSSECPNA